MLFTFNMNLKKIVYNNRKKSRNKCVDNNFFYLIKFEFYLMIIYYL